MSSSVPCTSWSVADAGFMDAAPLAGESNQIGGLAEVAQDGIFEDVFLCL